MLRPDEKQTAIKQKIRGTLGPLLSLWSTYIPVNGFPRAQSEAQPCQRRRADPRGLAGGEFPPRGKHLSCKK